VVFENLFMKRLGERKSSAFPKAILTLHAAAPLTEVNFPVNLCFSPMRDN